MSGRVKTVRPQPGPQEMFLSTSADIAIYGGGAGGGKTWALLLEPLRHINNKGFGAVFFRRTSPQIKNEGGLWDESITIYSEIPGAEPIVSVLDWKFKSGASVSFRHLEHEKTKLDWQGSQIALINFDELTHFTETQFWYLASRNRTMCGVRPYIRATCNPDPDSWVADLIAWWIDEDTGAPIPERAGVVRHFIRLGNKMIWADTPEELAEYTYVNEEGDDVPIPTKSLTFVPALVTDNKALMKQNPDYIATLMSLPTVERERLLGGNWKIRASDGMFDREWFGVPVEAEELPRMRRKIRAWDLASTDDKKMTAAQKSRQAATASVLMGEGEDGIFYILDVEVDRVSPAGQIKMMTDTAKRDGPSVFISYPQDPGQAGKSQVQFIAQKLAGYEFGFSIESGDKATRAKPLAAQAQAGNVKILRGRWNRPFFDELESFPTGVLKDQVDAASRAFNQMTHGVGAGVHVSRLRVVRR